MKSLNDIFHNSLSLDPEYRDLELIVLLLESSVVSDEGETASPEESSKKTTQEIIDDQLLVQNQSNNSSSYVLSNQTNQESRVTNDTPETVSSNEGPINMAKTISQIAESAQSPGYWFQIGFKVRSKNVR